MLRRLESGAPSAHARLTLIRRLRAARVTVQVGAAPWIPGVSDARALLAAVPSDVIVQFGPLDLAQLPVDDPLGIGRRFTQAKIDADYLKERRRVGASAMAVPDRPRARHHELHAAARRARAPPARRPQGETPRCALASRFLLAGFALTRSRAWPFAPAPTQPRFEEEGDRSDGNAGRPRRDLR